MARVLFIGGTGVISSACVRRALADGHEVSVLNRGRASNHPLPAEARSIVADINDDVDGARAALDGLEFDTVAEFIAFTPDQVRRDIELFRERCAQYIFISSASAYQTPPAVLPVRESTPLRNPLWGYSQDKIACEDVLVSAYRADGFPGTIVRPSHTYDQTMLPFDGGWTVVERMRAGKGVVVHGDGTSLWTLTHHDDFAVGFSGLLGRPDAAGMAFHITNEQPLAWNAIFTEIGRAAGVEPELVHVPSEAIAAADSDWGAGLLGDKAHSMVFDNTLIRQFSPDFTGGIPFSEGARQIIAWHDADPARRVVDERIDAVMDALVERWRV